MDFLGLSGSRGLTSKGEVGGMDDERSSQRRLFWKGG